MAAERDDSADPRRDWRSFGAIDLPDDVDSYLAGEDIEPFDPSTIRSILIKADRLARERGLDGIVRRRGGQAVESLGEADGLRLRASRIVSKTVRVWSRFGLLLPLRTRANVFGPVLAEHRSDFYAALVEAGSRGQQDRLIVRFTITAFATVLACTVAAFRHRLLDAFDTCMVAAFRRHPLDEFDACTRAAFRRRLLDEFDASTVVAFWRRLLDEFDASTVVAFWRRLLDEFDTSRKNGAFFRYFEVLWRLCCRNL
jgi:hypothetical protein